jgi:hypothetical protein
MDLIVDSDIYTPCVDNNGNYIDKVPSFNNIKNGLRCPCGTRKDKTYDCSSYFSTHIKSQTHKRWLLDINANKKNFYTENVVLKETIHNQKLIIARLQKEIIIKSNAIDCLTEQWVLKNNLHVADVVEDLIIFD